MKRRMILRIGLISVFLISQATTLFPRKVLSRNNKNVFAQNRRVVTIAILIVLFSANCESVLESWFCHPPHPENLTATATGPNRVWLDWSIDFFELSDCCLYFDIYRNGDFIDWTTDEHYEDSGLSPGTEYCYVVESIGWDCEDPYNYYSPGSGGEDATKCVTTYPLNSFSWELNSPNREFDNNNNLKFAVSMEMEKCLEERRKVK